jgi:hypothetical protein
MATMKRKPEPGKLIKSPTTRIPSKSTRQGKRGDVIDRYDPRGR